MNRSAHRPSIARWTVVSVLCAATACSGATARPPSTTSGRRPSNSPIAPVAAGTGNRPAPITQSGDGKIAFGSRGFLYMIEPDGSGLRRVVSICRWSGCGVRELAWSPDGRQLAFGYAGRPDDWSLFLVGQDGGRVRALTSCHAGCGEDDFPTWAPDGSKVAFMRNVDQGGGNYVFHMYVVDRNGSNLTRLSPAGMSVGSPTWSPDASRVAWTVDDGYPSTLRTRVVVSRTDGTGSVDLVGGKSGRNPLQSLWSPDGREIAYQTVGGGRGQVWVIDADGSNPRELYDAPSISGLSWSPDGRRLAIITNGSLLVMNADGTGRSVLAGTGVDAAPVKMGSSSPVWSPSGTMLACWLGDRLIVVNANGKGERTVARVPYRPGSLIAWQPVAA